MYLIINATVAEVTAPKQKIKKKMNLSSVIIAIQILSNKSLLCLMTLCYM